MLRLKNTTAPPETQAGSRVTNKVSAFDVYLVMVKTSQIVLQGLPVMEADRALAEKLAEMLKPEYPGRAIYIRRCSYPISEFSSVARVASRNRDMIINCLTADRPGHEYLARLGSNAMYDARIDPGNDRPAEVGK